MFSKIKIRNSFVTKAALAAVAVCVASPAAMAAIVCQSPNLAIPNDISGVYLNLITGASGTSSGAAPGWDIDPYNNNAGLTFYGAASPSGVLATGTPGTTAVASALASGASVSPTPTPAFYNQFQTVGTNFQTAGTRFLGLKFQNEGTGVPNYAWLEIVSGATAGFPATISRYCYQDDGTAITVGTTPVTLQNYSVD